MSKLRNIAESFNPLSTADEHYRQTDRQTDGFAIANTGTWRTHLRVIKRITMFVNSLKITKGWQLKQITCVCVMPLTPWPWYSTLAYMLWRCICVSKRKLVGQDIQRDTETEATERNTTLLDYVEMIDVWWNLKQFGSLTWFWHPWSRPPRFYNRSTTMELGWVKKNGPASRFVLLSIHVTVCLHCFHFSPLYSKPLKHKCPV